MSRQKQIWVILLGLLLILTNSLRETKAQPSPAPLLMTVRGALWSWQQGQKPQPITGEQYNHEPVLSSDGRYLAYAADHQLAIDLLKEGLISSQNNIPRDIWLVDRLQNTLIRVAEQPLNASFRKGSNSNYVARSRPTWSPDGRSLAWMEFRVDAAHPSGTSQIVIYHLQTENYDYAQIPSQSDIPEVIMPILWGKAGLSIIDATNGDYHLFLLNEQAEIISDTLIDSESAVVNNPHDLFWLLEGEKEYLATPSSPEMLDPQTGETVIMNGLYVLSNPLVKSSIRIILAPRETRENGIVNWYIIDSGGRTLSIPDVGPRMSFPLNFAVSPDGQDIAFVDQSGDNALVMVYHDGHFLQVLDETQLPDSLVYPGVQGITWAKNEWKLLRPPQ